MKLVPLHNYHWLHDGTYPNDVPITLLPGHNRHMIALGKSIAWLDRRYTMISGTLPSRGWQVAIVYRDRSQNSSSRSLSPDGYPQYAASVEGDAYYAIGLPDGKVTVRLYNAWRETWLDFDGGQIEYAKGRRAILRNITERDVSQKLRDLARRTPTCVTTKSGVTICTPPD